jgi:hypothetical protein
MKIIEIVMYVIAISLNISALMSGLLIISQENQVGIYTINFQIFLTIGAVIFTFTALLISIMRKQRAK